MREVYLYRLASTDEGTPGIMAIDGLFWHSLELPDRGNKPNISRIPSGSYKVKRRFSPHFKREVYWLQGTNPRTFILIHPANFAGDVKKGWQSHLQGCITLGKKVGRAPNKYGKKQKCVFSSRIALNEFEEEMDKKEFKLTIKDI